MPTEHKALLLSINIGSTASEETKIKMSKASKGKSKSKTHCDNISRGRFKSPNIRGSNLPWSKLNEEQVINIRVEASNMDGTMSGRRIQRILGEKYNVSHETIRAVLSQRTWKHI